jgi:enoyl-[acyl-carrier-protein] reductase (NADH)
MQTTKKFVGVEQVAAMSLFLASEAGLNVTGASFFIDFC